MEKILRIGHRGAGGYEPENTLVSFQKALDMQVDGIELDVHLSSDGELIVIHDETIDRTTSGKGFVNKLSLRELKTYNIDGKHKIPTLREVFDLVNHNCFINIELKGSGTAKPVLELIEHYILEKNWKYSHFLISSFDCDMLKEVHFLNPRIPIGVITDESIEQALAFAKKIKAHSVHPNYQLLSKENVALMQENGFEVFAWTVNTTSAIHKIKSFNVNGIISDFPDKI
jgi:glycerophosphoryl diester phosphodiesterase